MVKQLLPLLAMLSAVALYTHLGAPAEAPPAAPQPAGSPSLAEGYTVDGVALGASRRDVEMHLSPTDCKPVGLFEGPTFTALAIFGGAAGTGRPGERRMVAGNPGALDSTGPPVRVGVPYGMFLPVVGYDREGKVSWVCGDTLETPEGDLWYPGCTGWMPTEFRSGRYGSYALDGHLKIVEPGDGTLACFVLSVQPLP